LSLCRDTNIDDQTAQASLEEICKGSSISFPTPPARQRSAALQKRLADLQADLDNKQYAAMVQDITEKERFSKEQQQDNFFPTTKLQLSFGLHVLVTMGTFFALAYYGARFAKASQAWVSSGCRVSVLGLKAGVPLTPMWRSNLPESMQGRV
jgi:hypothetical protein